MHKPTTKTIAQSAIDTAYQLLEAHNMQADTTQLSRDLSREIARKGRVLVVTLITPMGNADASAQKIQELLEEKLARPIDLIQKADPTLLGGAILLYEDVRIDRSVRGALTRATEHLKTFPTT
jgi:F0F1-type ATP synthase delta subunit